MATSEMVQYALFVVLFWAVFLGPSIGVVSRTLLRTQRARDIEFGLGSAFCGVGGADVAHRLVSDHTAVAYLYVLGLPVGSLLLLLLVVRLGPWRPTPPLVRAPRVAPAKSRVH